jgi:two-component sensor histidine kinase
MDGKRPLRVSTAATAVIAAMFLALLVLLGLWLRESWASSIRRTEDRAIAASKIVATNAGWVNALARQALQRIDESLGPMPDGTGIAPGRAINEAVANLPGQAKAYVVDADGNTLYSTDPQIKPINITDRDYFAALKAGRESYVSGLIVSRLSGKQIFVFSRRLDRAGKFAGAVMLSFEGEVLKDVWEAVDLGPNSTVGIIRGDGQLVARYPPPPGPVDMSKYVLFTEHLPKSPSGTYLATSPVDSASRLVAYQKVGNTAFVAVGSTDFKEGMKPFWEDVSIALSVLLLAGAGSIAAGGWIRHLLKRDTDRSARLSAALEENQLLLREIHHRVKNNLQSVQAVVRMQQMPPDAQKSLSDRISAMIAVHEQIYSRDQFARVAARDLLPAVVGTLLRAYGDQVEAHYDIDDILISADNATPLALLANEVVTNSLKYAFPDGRAGRLTISMKAGEGRRACLTIADNGVGFDAANVRTGMGTRLIRGVVGQLHGHFRLETVGGAAFIADLDIMEPKVPETEKT